MLWAEDFLVLVCRSPSNSVFFCELMYFNVEVSNSSSFSTNFASILLKSCSNLLSFEVNWSYKKLAYLSSPSSVFSLLMILNNFSSHSCLLCLYIFAIVTHSRLIVTYIWDFSSFSIQSLHKMKSCILLVWLISELSAAIVSWISCMSSGNSHFSMIDCILSYNISPKHSYFGVVDLSAPYSETVLGHEG